jgi:hypothetical protein
MFTARGSTPLDQFRTFQALSQKGQSEEEIAAACFVGLNVVKQRLRLATAPSSSSAERRGDPRCASAPDMVGDETHDAFGDLRRQSLRGVAEAPGQAIDPQATLRIEHDLDDGRIYQPVGDCRPHRRTHHANAARSRFRFERNRPHAVHEVCDRLTRSNAGDN